MSIWAIADTHLSFAKNRDMARYGAKWVNHAERLANAWRQRIAPHDVVLLPGDVSWAQSPSNILPDLAWLTSLPGEKVLLRGNHDHWWKDVQRARALAEPLGFRLVDGDSLDVGEAVICGAMGHVAPEDPYFRPDPKKDRFGRELQRLDSALRHATAHRRPDQPIILMMHYPPFTSDGKRTAYVDVISHYRPDVCLYGHLHQAHEWEVACKSRFEDVQYALVAADFLDMTPRRVHPFAVSEPEKEHA